MSAEWKKNARRAKAAFKEGRPEMARKLVLEAIAMHPREPKLYLLLALSESALGNEEAARQALGKLSRRIVRGEIQDGLLDLVDIKLAHYPVLREYFLDSILKRYPGHVQAGLILSRLYLGQERLNRARGVLLSLLSVNLESRLVWKSLEEVLMAQGDSDALSHIQKYLEGLVEPQWVLERLLREAEEIDKSHRSDTGSFSELRHSADELSGLIQHLDGQLGGDEAELLESVRPQLDGFLEQARPQLTSDPKTRLDLARAFWEMDLKTVAIQELSEISEQAPCYLESRCVMAEMKIELESEMEALEIVQQCLRHPDITEGLEREALYLQLLIYIRLQDWDKAREIWEGLNQRTPSYRDLKYLGSVVRNEGRRGK